MEVYTKENVIQTVVEVEIIATKEKFWQGFEDLVLDQIVAALTLNQLNPHYCTFAEGRNIQLKEVTEQIPNIKTLITKNIRKARDLYDKDRDVLLDKAVNVTEEIVTNYVEDFLTTYHQKNKDKIIPAQIEAIVLNKLPHHYAATVRGKNRLKIDISQDRPFRIESIRRAVNQVMHTPRFGEPLTEQVRTSVVWRKEEAKKSPKDRLRRNYGQNFKGFY